jgi:hypothetical protein
VRTYEAAPRKIASSRRLVAVPLLFGAVVVSAGIAGSLMPRRAEPTPTPRVAPSINVPLVATGGVDCGRVSRFDCVTVADAARDALRDVPFRIVSIQMWPTLICGDDLDCPRAMLERADPIGSAAVTFEDRGVAWIDVFRRFAPNRLDETRQLIEARVVRFFRSG